MGPVRLPRCAGLWALHNNMDSSRTAGTARIGSAGFGRKDKVKPIVPRSGTWNVAVAALHVSWISLPLYLRPAHPPVLSACCVDDGSLIAQPGTASSSLVRKQGEKER
jgi:hypothetical protein